MATEAPNNLISNTRIKVTDLLGEGIHYGFWPQSGISGSNPLCAVYLDDTPIMNGDGSANYNISGRGFQFRYVSGTSGQQPMEGFGKVEALVPLPLNTAVTNPPPNNGYPKPLIVSFNTAMYPDAEGVKVTLRVPALYTVNTTNGDTNQFSLFYEIDISLNGGEWVPQILGTDGNGDPSTVNEIKGKCTSSYYRTLILPLPKTTPASTSYTWKVRVRRIDVNVLAQSTANSLFVDSIAVISSNTYRYPMSAMVGLEMSADQFGSIPTRAYDVMGTQVLVPLGYTPTQYNSPEYGQLTAAVYPSVWNGVFGPRQWTDNPAWIFYDICTNKRYGLGNYIRTEWMDKWTLYQIAQYCDEMVDNGNGGLEPRFTCNVAIQTPQDAYTLLNNLVSVFRGMLYWANGRVFPVGSETRDPVFNFSNANVVGGAFNYSDTPRTTRSTVCTVRWNDPANLFRSTPERISDPAGRAIYGIIEKEITAFATTSRGQAIRAANWILTAEQQLTETVQFQSNMGGIYLRPGDVINVYDNLRNNQQQGGCIADFNATRDTIILDKPVTLFPSFTYFMAAMVPATNVADGSGITGSSQIGLIRNSQIETREVATAPGTGLTTLSVYSPFSTNLFRGSIFILSASGNSVTVFDKATQYKVLSTAEPEPGKVAVLAVEYQTGINYLVNNNYSSVTNAPIEGNTTPPSAPTGTRGYRVTGLLNDNTFFSYGYIDWTGTAPSDTAYFDVSGRRGGGPWFSIGLPTVTGIQFVPDGPGTYSLAVAAFNANGYGSAYNSGVYIEPNTNPFGTTVPLSGIIINNGFDPYSYSVALNRYTGYVGASPTFLWDASLDQQDDTLEVPSAQYVTGYRARIISATGGQWNLLANPIIIEGKDNNQLTWNDRFLYTGTSIKPLRAFTLDIETMDEFGGIASGARLIVNNQHPQPPVGSGFVGYNGGVSYNITPARTADVSGVYVWVNQNPLFTPTFDNATLLSTNLAGFANGPQTGSVYTWFSLVDSYGPSGSILANGDYNAPIYGPISGNTNQVVGTLFVNLDNQISGAFSLLTGTFTNYFNILSGENQTTLLAVNGLSGQVVGTTPGAANTALTIRVDSAVLSASGATATQINAVSARLQQTGSDNFAQTATVATALATTGGALSAFDIALQAYTSGANSRVQIAAQAFVTGDLNGMGGVAVARYGFELNATNNRASLVATSTSFPGSKPTLELDNFDIQSNSFVAGSAGWRIKYDGSAEFSNVIARGAFTGGAGSSQTSINQAGLTVGTLGGDRLQMQSTLSNHLFTAYNSSNAQTVSLGNLDIGGGVIGGALFLNTSAGSPTIALNGGNGNVNCDTLDVDSTSNFDNNATFLGDIYLGNSSSTRFFYLDNDSAQIVLGDGSDPVNLYRNAANEWKTDDSFTVAATCSANAFNTTSSERFKQNVRPISGALTVLHRLQGVVFDWRTKDMKDDIGFIAERVYDVLPTIVGKDSDGVINGLDYGKVSALTVEAIKELDIRLRALEGHQPIKPIKQVWPLDSE